MARQPPQVGKPSHWGKKRISHLFYRTMATGALEEEEANLDFPASTEVAGLSWRRGRSVRHRLADCVSDGGKAVFSPRKVSIEKCETEEMIGQLMTWGTSDIYRVGPEFGRDPRSSYEKRGARSEKRATRSDQVPSLWMSRWNSVLFPHILNPDTANQQRPLAAAGVRARPWSRQGSGDSFPFFCLIR